MHHIQLIHGSVGALHVNMTNVGVFYPNMTGIVVVRVINPRRRSAVNDSVGYTWPAHTPEVSHQRELPQSYSQESKPESVKRRDAAHIRAWAIQQGIPVGKRGRIKPDVIARYDEANVNA